MSCNPDILPLYIPHKFKNLANFVYISVHGCANLQQITSDYIWFASDEYYLK